LLYKRIVDKRASFIIKHPINGSRNCQHVETLFGERCGISFLWSTEEQKVAEQQASRMEEPHLCPGCRWLLPAQGRERGLVKWYNARRHYGFIARRNSGELYLHGSVLREPGRLATGDLVEFAVGANERGPMATDVYVLERGHAAKDDAVNRRK
jgi:CspA family cold shock protein